MNTLLLALLTPQVSKLGRDECRDVLELAKRCYEQADDPIESDVLAVVVEKLRKRAAEPAPKKVRKVEAPSVTACVDALEHVAGRKLSQHERKAVKGYVGNERDVNCEQVTALQNSCRAYLAGRVTVANPIWLATDLIKLSAARVVARGSSVKEWKGD